jgi:Uma2 family endonuclease
MPEAVLTSTGLAPSLADLVARLGGIPLDRILLDPPPGSATEQDVLFDRQGEKRLCELVDGVLVRKPMGYYESWAAGVLISLLSSFLAEHPLGIVAGEAGALRLAPGLVRVPDVSFLAWERFPGGVLPTDPIPALAPDLAVEILSRTNTPAEMERKVREYFEAGARLVWLVDPVSRTAEVYRGPQSCRVVAADGVLEGKDVLPGFQVSLADWLQPPQRPEPGESEAL